VFANFGMAMDARMPMITTTMSNSIRVKPARPAAIGIAGLACSPLGSCRFSLRMSPFLSGGVKRDGDP